MSMDRDSLINYIDNTYNTNEVTADFLEQTMIDMFEDKLFNADGEWDDRGPDGMYSNLSTSDLVKLKDILDNSNIEDADTYDVSQGASISNQYPSADGKVYTYKGCSIYAENGSIYIEDELVDEIPPSLLSNKAVREAIYLAYTNFGDTWVGTIYRIIRERASFKDLDKIERVLNEHGDSLYNY